MPDSSISRHQNIFPHFSESPTGHFPRGFPQKTAILSNLRFIRSTIRLIYCSIISKSSSFDRHFGQRVRFHVSPFNSNLIFISHYALSRITNATNKLNLTMDRKQKKYVKAFFIHPFDLRLVIYEIYVMYPRFRTRQTTEKKICVAYMRWGEEQSRSSSPQRGRDFYLRYRAQAFSGSIHCSVHLVLGPLLRVVKLQADHSPPVCAVVQKAYNLSMVIRHRGKFIITQSPSQFPRDSGEGASTVN